MVDQPEANPREKPQPVTALGDGAFNNTSTTPIATSAQVRTPNTSITNRLNHPAH
jgi:hypothetical protein